MAMVTCTIGLGPYKKTGSFEVLCRKRDREREKDRNFPYQVIEITPPPKSLGVRCFPPNLQCGESVTIEGHAYTISAVTHRYQLRKGKYEPTLYKPKRALEGVPFDSERRSNPHVQHRQEWQSFFNVGPQELIGYNGTTISRTICSWGA